MATQQSTADYILDQIAKAGAVSARKMFGEYGLYCGGKLVALVCDEQLFVKPTRAGRAHIGDVNERPPYPGAKPCFLISEDRWDDGDWLTQLIRVTTADLPAPAKKRGAQSPRTSRGGDRDPTNGG